MSTTTNVVEKNGFSPLNDLKIETNNKKDDFIGSFSVCFWLFLPRDSASHFPSTLLHHHNSCVTSATPFLAMNVNKELVLYPLCLVPPKGTLPKDAARTKNEVPLNKWFHIGCEVTTDIMRLYMNGVIIGEMCEGSTSDSLRKVSLVGSNEHDSVYVHGVEVLPIMSSIKDYIVKDPPVQLHFDATSATDIEVDSDGVWSVIGGKIACRRNFSLNVVLKNAFGRSANKEMEFVSTLTYADNGAPVEKPDDAKAPLLTTKDGTEFASWDTPSKLINGHASFRLKISQLSSRCDNRLFRVKFYIPKMGKRYPFLEAFSRPIRCISRNPTLIWKRSTSAIHTTNGTCWLDGGFAEPMNNIVHEEKLTPVSKRIKLGQANPIVNIKPVNLPKQQDVDIHKDDKTKGMTLESIQVTNDRTSSSSSDSDSSEAANSCKSLGSNESLVSDVTVFKYCLGTLTEKSLLLKDLATSASNKDIMNFADQVSQFSGCHHHRNIIRISKRMIEEGTKVWSSLSQNNHVLWENLILVLRDHFIKISCCRNRFLVYQDFEVLRRIGGCQEMVTQENFEKMWCWLYPVAFALSQNKLNEMWDSRWIEGIVTKEEAESALHGIRGRLVDPGTFVLRFPTSRSWPHPDAGNLIITYVGSDFAIHHRLLSLDFLHSSAGKSLKEMLLEECELCRLGRITSRSMRLV